MGGAKGGEAMTTTKRAAAERATAKRATTTRKTAATKAARKTTAKKTTAKKATVKAGAGRYTQPALRERLKARILNGSKGGRAGQWSARKAQLLAHEYEAEGGGYRGGRSETQRHLAAWTDEQWTTADGRKAARKGGTTRYLPKQAWSELSEGEKAATNRKKVEGSRRGRQYVANTTRAKRARKAAAR
jgi:hypothetical protein